MDVHPLVAERRGAEREVRHGESDEVLVRLDDVYAIDRLVLDELAHGSAVARADDKHVPDVRMDGHRHVCKHLVVDELVLLSEEQLAVQDEDSPVFDRVQNVDALVFALLGRDLPHHLH